MAAAAVLINRKIAISRPRFGLKLKREVELFQYGGLLFHAAGIGFVRCYNISLAISRKTANINVKKTVVL